MSVTPPPTLRTAIVWSCVLRTLFFGLEYCVPFNNKTSIFSVSIYIKKIFKTLCCIQMYNISWKRKLWCVCLLDFLVFYLPKSMFMLKMLRIKYNYLTLYVMFFKLDLFKVNNVVCVWYRIFCVMRTDPLRTAYRLKLPWIMRTKKEGVTLSNAFVCLEATLSLVHYMKLTPHSTYTCSHHETLCIPPACGNPVRSVRKSGGQKKMALEALSNWVLESFFNLCSVHHLCLLSNYPDRPQYLNCLRYCAKLK